MRRASISAFSAKCLTTFARISRQRRAALIGRYLEASEIAFDSKIEAFGLYIYPRFARDYNVVRDPDVFDKPFPLGNRWIGLEIMRTVRNKFPYFAVVFQDRNVDEEMFMGLDISEVSRHIDVKEASGPMTYGPKRGKQRAKMLIANVGDIDMFELDEGFVSEVPPAHYHYCASKKRISTEKLIQAVEQSMDEWSFLQGLVRTCDILLHAGADTVYFVLLSRDQEILEGIRRSVSA